MYKENDQASSGISTATGRIDIFTGAVAAFNVPKQGTVLKDLAYLHRLNPVFSLQLFHNMVQPDQARYLQRSLQQEVLSGFCAEK